MKFSTPSGIGVVRSNQKAARECYIIETKELGEVIVLTSSLDGRMNEVQNERLNPIEIVEPIKLIPSD